VWAIVALYVSLTIRRGWLASESVTAERLTCLHLVAQASKAQALLETAVPRSVARALIAGVPAAGLTRSFASASIAFIALADFEERAVHLGPHELILWLDACYSVFDCLVDLYGEAINKIETVR
jgi:class 3 adenylate cyclase